MYFVKNWETDETIDSFEKLTTAKRYCRGQGHTGQLAPNGQYLPIAYVADDEGYLVYNPRFKATIGDAASQLINARSSDHF